MNYAADLRARTGVCLACRHAVQWGVTGDGVMMSVVPSAMGPYEIRGSGPATIRYVTPNEHAYDRFARHRCRTEGRTHAYSPR